MNGIDEDIKNRSFKRIYLLTGKESYLRLEYRNKLKNSLCRPGDNMNVMTFTGKDVPVKEVISFSETMPFFADRRVVFLEDTELFADKEDELSEYLQNVPETTCIIFVQEEVDKRKKLYKAIQKYGRVVLFEKPSPEIIKDWILKIIQRAGLKIKKSAFEVFVSRDYPDMMTMRSELDKLIGYCLDKGEILAEDVEGICTVRAEDRVFNMIEFIAQKKRGEALKCYYDLLTLKVPPMKILSIMGSQFNRLLLVKSMKKEGVPDKEIAEKLGIQPFAVGKSLKNAYVYTLSELAGMVKECTDHDWLVKQGRMNDVMSVEILIVRFTGGGDLKASV